MRIPGESPAGHEVRHRQSAAGKGIDNHARAERGALDEGSIHVLWPRGQRHPNQQPREVGVHEGAAVAVPPVECQQATGAWRETGGTLAEHVVNGSAAGLRLFAICRGNRVRNEPRENVSDSRLPGLIAVVSRRDPVFDDPGGPRHLRLAPGHHEVTRGGAHDEEERTRPGDPRPEHRGMRIDDWCGDRRAGGQTEPVGPVGAQPAEPASRGHDRALRLLLVEPGQPRIQRAEEFG